LFTYDVYDDLIKLKGTKEDFDKYKVRARTPARTCSLALTREGR
jgi:hypothetical protein